MSLEWPEHEIEFLREHWGQPGWTGAKIGAALKSPTYPNGRTKSMICGKAHRLDLPKLANSWVGRTPVSQEAQATAKREYARRRREAKKAGIEWQPQNRGPARKPTLSALPSLIAIANEPFKHEVEPMPKRPTNPAPPPLRRQPLPPQVPRSASVVLGVLSQCCWPIGEPGTRDFKFCCEPVEAVGKSYCPDHMKVAYVTRVRERVW